LNEKILIVKSETEEAKALSFLLSGTGYSTTALSSGKEALEVAQNERFDLAITDRFFEENQAELGLVAQLKEAQPKLPVLLLSEGHELEDIIGCIRAGVTDIIDEPKNLKKIFDSTNKFFNRDTTSHGAVTWEDMMEVEQALSTLFKMNGPSKVLAEEAEAKSLQNELDETKAKLEQLEKSNQELITSKANAETLLEEMTRQNGGSWGETTEKIERMTDLEEREKKLKEREALIAKQKAEAEVMLADLEAMQAEAEENDGEAAHASGELQRKFDAAQMQWNATRLDLEAQIADLNRDLEQAKVASSGSSAQESEIEALKESLQQSKESITEKDFLIEQRTKEIEDLKAKIETRASNLDMEELEEANRLLEIDRFKLQEQKDKLDEAQHSFDQDFQIKQREIEVNRKDAEVTLRELQHKVKEEQLKLASDQAAFKEEVRQFEQAKQNFQEDIEELQSKQSELKQFEDQLNRMKSSLDQQENTLPKHKPSEDRRPDRAYDEEYESASYREEEASGAADSVQSPEAGDDKSDPRTWKKPPQARSRKGARGPLRIGRSASVDD